MRGEREIRLKWSAIYAILMSMFLSELASGTVMQLRLQTHITSPVTYLWLQSPMTSPICDSSHKCVSSVTTCDLGHMLTFCSWDCTFKHHLWCHSIPIFNKIVLRRAKSSLRLRFSCCTVLIVFCSTASRRMIWLSASSRTAAGVDKAGGMVGWPFKGGADGTDWVPPRWVSNERIGGTGGFLEGWCLVGNCLVAWVVCCWVWFWDSELSLEPLARGSGDSGSIVYAACLLTWNKRSKTYSLVDDPLWDVRMLLVCWVETRDLRPIV